VVVQLCSSCTHLSEEEEQEELAKLGVDGSNCWATKGHQTSPCTPDVEWPKLETPIHRSLQWLEETLVTSERLQVAQLVEDIIQEMEGDLDLLLTQQHQVEEMMEKLQQVNQSLGLMLVAMEGAQNQLEKHLQHLHANLDPAGQWLVTATHRDAEEAWPAFPCHQLTSTPDRERELKLLQEELDRMEMSCLQEPSVLEQSPTMAQDVPSLGQVSPVPGGWRSKLSSYGVMPELAPGVKPYSPIQSLASDRSLLSPRSPCQGLTRVGQRCRKKAIPGQDFCHVHTTGRTLCSSLAMDSSPHI
ncbi:hypothetical protein Q9233_016144, partial [Columba guinea]